MKMMLRKQYRFRNRLSWLEINNNRSFMNIQVKLQNQVEIISTMLILLQLLLDQHLPERVEELRKPGWLSRPSWPRKH